MGNGHVFAYDKGIRVPVRAVRAALLCCVLGLVVLALAGCEKTTYAQSIRIVAEPMNANGLFAQVEYLRDGKVANSVHLVDGDGDGIIDGKAGPEAGGDVAGGVAVVRQHVRGYGRG